MSKDLEELPKPYRIKAFKVGAWANGLMASLFLTLFLRCTLSQKRDLNDLWEARLKDVKEMSKQAGAEAVKQASNEIQPKINEVQFGIDSLTQKIDSIKQKKS